MVERMGRNFDVFPGSNKYLAMFNITLYSVDCRYHITFQKAAIQYSFLYKVKRLINQSMVGKVTS